MIPAALENLGQFSKIEPKALVLKVLLEDEQIEVISKRCWLKPVKLIRSLVEIQNWIAYILMIVTFFMTLAVLFGGLVLVILFVGRKYEVRHNVGKMDEELEEDEQQLNITKTIEESNSKEKL